MATPITTEQVTRACADALATVCAHRLADTAIVQPATAVTGSGWVGTVGVSGAASGQLSAWFDRQSALTLSRGILKRETDPDDDTIVALLRELLGEANSSIETTSAAAGLILATPSIAFGNGPESGSAYRIAFSGGLSFQMVVGAEFRSASAAPKTDMRLEAVLDVDLPLVVRFGRAIMPLRSLADLGPGSVVDMGRSPDDPVELLVGERLIARGEVVIVGGNYGVRITELAGGTPPTGETEMRIS
jgi:flagellar motor switch protein FliN